MLLFLFFACQDPIITEETGLWTQTTTTECQEIETNPGMDSEGNQKDGWNWEKLGLIFDIKADVGDGDFSPALVEANNKLLLVFSRKVGLNYTLYYSWSEDGLIWTDPKPTVWTNTAQSTYPSLLFDGKKYLMWVGSGSFASAESQDGQTWMTTQEYIFGAGDTFDSLSVLYPSVYKKNQDLGMFYTGFDGGVYSIGHAETVNGEWEAHQPMFGPDQGSYDNRSVAQPSVYASESNIYIWYGAYDTSKTDPSPWRIALAELNINTNEIIKYGVSLPLSQSGTDAWSTRDPAPIFFNGKWIMVYVGMGDDSIYRLHLATSNICFP